MPYSIDSIQNAAIAAIAGNFDSFESMLDQTPHAIYQVIFPNNWEEIARQESQYLRDQIDQINAFDIAFIQAHPDACIRVVYRNYPQYDDNELLFVTESVFQKWLETQRWWAYQEYCQGYGNGDVSHLSIRAYYPDGSVESYA